ncbi:MAG: DedA family protein [Chitinophagales bacterium]
MYRSIFTIMILLSIADFFHHLFQHPSELFDPEKLIKYGGPAILFLIIFAQTGLFFCFMLPGDVLIFTAGVFFASGHFHHNILIIFLVLATASLLGNITGYWVGRETGVLLMKKKDSWFFSQEYLSSAKEFYDRYKGWAITGGMFIPVIRSFAPVIAGIIRLDFRKYLGYIAAGSIAWTGSLVSLGYFLGNIHWVRKNIHFITLFLMVAIAVLFTLRMIKEVKKAKAKAQRKKSADTF